MTNFEYYKDEILKSLELEKEDEIKKWSVFNYDRVLGKVLYRLYIQNKGDGIAKDFKIVNWLLEEHKEPIKLKQWEKDLVINCTQVEDYQEKDKVHEFWIITGMKEKGYFKGIEDTSMTLKEILDNCEVIDE